jgi:iron complex transport system ATP-binding protein
MSADFLIADALCVSLGARQVLSNVAFALPQSGLIALVGPNGAGKTTLLRALAGLVTASGTIAVGAMRLADMTAHERSLRFAYLPQGHVVHWPLLVRDVVALGRFPHGARDPTRLSEIDRIAVEKAMAATDVLGFAERKVTELSGGEKSRVALARTLAVEAPVLLADEPIASLDPRHQLEVMDLLRQVARGGTLVVVVTHDVALAARFADHVLVLNEGRLVTAAQPAEAFTASMLHQVFGITAFQTDYEGEPVLMPWRT